MVTVARQRALSRERTRRYREKKKGDGADLALDGIVTAVCERLSAGFGHLKAHSSPIVNRQAEADTAPVVLPDHSTALVELQATRWSVSAGGPSSVIRGAAIGLAVAGVE